MTRQQQMRSQQPVQVVWMVMPEKPTGQACPPGLEYFSKLNKLVIKQKIELLEALTGYEQENRYDVFNEFEQKVYQAKEDSECCQRQWCGASRTIDMRLVDASDREVMHFKRPFAQMCCNRCCLSVLTIEAPVGTPIGAVRQMPGNCKREFHVECPEGNHVLTIDCPHACKCFCCSVPYPVLDLQGEQVGKISVVFAWKSLVTDANNFFIEFDETLDVKLKACLMGGLFLIDFMFYEH